jgi:toxin ParE1/3/4
VSVGVRFTVDAREDVSGIAKYIAEDSVDAALKFGPAVERTLAGLAEFPGKGSPKEFDSPRLAGIRSYAVDGFRKYLIYYRRDPDGAIRILTITHGGRNVAGLLLRRM